MRRLQWLFHHRLCRIADALNRTYRVPEEQLIVSKLEYGTFEDLIPIRGNIQPLISVFLGAASGVLLKSFS